MPELNFVEPDLQPTTLRPGWLVSLSTELKGNISYRKEEIEADHIDPNTGERIAVWKTERTIIDPAEHERAVKARGRARTILTGLCSTSKFGLLCPESRTADLQLAIKDARAIVREFNSTALTTQIGFFVVCGRVARDDVEAIRAINSEVTSLLATMETGVKNCDVKVIRDAATRAKGLGQMLTPVAQGELQEAIDVARRAARRIVEVGDQAALEIDREAIRALTQARTAFLDVDDPTPLPEAPEAIPEATRPELEIMSASEPELPGNTITEADPFNTATVPMPAIEFDFEPPTFMKRDWEERRKERIELDTDDA